MRNEQEKGLRDDDGGIRGDFCGHRDRVGGLRGDVLSIGEHVEKTPFSHPSDTASGRGSHHPPVANIHRPVTAMYFETALSAFKSLADDTVSPVNQCSSQRFLKK
jgi:hypothetical protein